VLRTEVRHAFQYISEEDEADFLPAFRDTVRLRYHPLAELRRNHRPYDLLRAVKYTGGFALGRLRGRRALLDDPYAVFAAPWLHRRVGCQVVVTVRDPVATVSSWQRLGWRPRLEELLAQPALVRDRLARFRAELEAAAADRSVDGVDAASLLWRVIYATVAAYRREIAGLEVVRHEDLSVDPLPAFAGLYDRLGLPLGPDAERAIARATSGGADQGVMRWSLDGGVSKTAARRLDSRANLEVWRERLTPAQADRVRELTADVAAGYGYAG
jgi:hypothetical protein